jgi:phage protein D
VADRSTSTVAQFEVKSNGSAIPPAMAEDLVEITVDGSVHLPDMAVLSFVDVDFRWSSADELKPGQELRIKFGYERELEEVFVGEITAVEISGEPRGGQRLLVRGYDRAHRMHRGRRTRTFIEMKDSEIASQIAGDLGLSADVEATKTVHEYVIQDNLTDWEFLRERARLNGCELQVQEKQLVFKKPPSTPAGEIELAYGVNLLSFSAEMTAAEQVGTVEVHGWDPMAKQEIVGTSKRAAVTTDIEERSTGGDLAKRSFNDTATMVIAREHVDSPGHAEAIAQAAINELEQSFVYAEGAVIGDPKMRLGTKVKLANVGDRFSGSYYISEVTHTFAQDGFHSRFRVTGRRATDVQSVLAPSEAPGVQVLTGVVSNTNDPLDRGRVKVRLPHLGPDVETHWARVVSPGAGPNRGFQAIPEIDDEVLLVGGDIHRLFVVGGLWNQGDRPPDVTADNVSGGEVQRRLWHSRTGHRVVLDDSQGSPGIIVEDSTGSNRVKINTQENSMKIEVTGDLTIDAGGKIEIKSGLNTSIDAGTDFGAKAGTGATVEAGTQLTAKGGASASLEGGVSTQVKGPTVNIGP